MNTNKAFIAGAILAMMVLSACEAETGAPTTPSTPAATQLNQQTATSTGTLDVQPGEQTAGTSTTPAVTTTTATSEATVPAHSEADTAAYESAQQLNDETFCDKIKDEAYKTQCKTALNDKKITAEALANLDESQCDKLSTDDKKEACKIRIQAIASQQKRTIDFDKQLQSDMDLMSKLEMEEDYKNCSQFKDENFRDMCEINILSKLAIKGKDSTICDKASKAETKDKCLEIYQTTLGI